MSRDLWQYDHIQFPRLLAEIMATQDKLDIPAIAESMDCTVEEVNELFDRADAAWEKTKERVLTPEPWHGPAFDYDDAIKHAEQTQPDRMYIKAGLFDVKLVKTDEGLVIDVYPWKEDGSEIVLATTYAFDQDAIDACEDDSE